MMLNIPPVKSRRTLPMLQPEVLLRLEKQTSRNALFLVWVTSAPVVHEGLRNILDEGDAELDVGAVVEKVKPSDDLGEGEDEADDNKHQNSSQYGQTNSGNSLGPSLEWSFKN